MLLTTVVRYKKSEQFDQYNKECFRTLTSSTVKCPSNERLYNIDQALMTFEELRGVRQKGVGGLGRDDYLGVVQRKKCDGGGGKENAILRLKNDNLDNSLGNIES